MLSCSAFTVTSIQNSNSKSVKRTKKSEVVANYKILDDHENENILTEPNSISQIQSINAEGSGKVSLDPIYLPRSAFLKDSRTKVEDLSLDLEMFFGRMAIVLGAYLLTQEFLTGNSFLDQLQGGIL